MELKEIIIPYKDKKEKKKNNRQYYKDNREKKLKQHKQWYQNNRKEVRKYFMMRRYGLSHEEWLEIWEDQDGKCAICKELFTTPSDAFIDHNHKTDEVRGLLCNRCNLGLGIFEDDPKIMINAIEYLSKNILRKEE